MRMTSLHCRFPCHSGTSGQCQQSMVLCRWIPSTVVHVVLLTKYQLLSPLSYATVKERSVRYHSRWWKWRQLSSSMSVIGHDYQIQQVALLWQRDRATRLSVEILQLQNIRIVWHYLRDPTFSRFYTIPECDRHTHRNGRTDTRRRHVLR